MYRFCPHCATPLAPFDERPYRRHCPACGWIHWGNPRPTTCALVEREGEAGRELMLVRRAIEPFRGMWDIPGGFVELEEEAEEALRRELREEASIEIEGPSLLGIWLDEYPYGTGSERTLNIVYRAHLGAGQVPQAGDDACEIGWFTAATMPPLDEIAFASGQAALACWLERQGRATPDRESD